LQQPNGLRISRRKRAASESTKIANDLARRRRSDCMRVFGRAVIEHLLRTGATRIQCFTEFRAEVASSLYTVHLPPLFCHSLKLSFLRSILHRNDAYTIKVYYPFVHDMNDAIEKQHRLARLYLSIQRFLERRKGCILP
jgi:hypothetical protein